MISVLEMLLNHQIFVLILEPTYIFLCNFFVAVQLKKINCEDISLPRQLFFAAILTAVVIVPNYVLIFCWQHLFSREALQNALPWIRFALIYRNPLWMLAYFWTARSVLRLSARDVANSSLLVFCFSELFALLSNSMETVYLPFQSILSPFAGFNLAHLLLILLLVAINLALSKYIDRNAHRLKLFFEAGNEEKKHPSLTNFLFGCALWCSLASIEFVLNVNRTIIYNYYYPASIALLSTLIVLLYRIRMNHVELHQANLHNAVLRQNLDDFHGIRHDLNNLLQVYNGFIETESYEELKSFHSKVYGEAVQNNDRLNLHLWLRDAPALYGLFLSMEELARTLSVEFEVKDVRAFKFIDMSDYDLCRLLSNLLKNAIESACGSSAPKVLVRISSHGGKAVVAIANTSPALVDASRIFEPGFSTKEGHSGRGLVEVNKVLAKYYGCTIKPVYKKPILTMYLVLPLKNSINPTEMSPLAI